MWTSRPSPGSAPFAGDRVAETGLLAAMRSATLATDQCLVEQHFAAMDPLIGQAFGNLIPDRSLECRLAGLSASGRRAAGFATGESLPGALSSLAGKPLPCVIHVLARALTRHARPLHGSDEIALQLINTGAFQLHAATVQEAADFALIAHRAAELSLRTGLVFQDPDAIGASVQATTLPEADLVQAYLGQPEDDIEAPTPAQRLMFGESRRRVPALMDRARPGSLGGAQDFHAFGLCGAARSPFLDGHVGDLIDQAMTEFGRLTGRRYDALFTHRVDDADVVLVCLGAERDRLCALIDEHRSRKRRIGLIAVTRLSPFPGGALASLLRRKRTVAVLERCARPSDTDPPLMTQLRAALDRATENGRGEPVHQGYPSFRATRDRPRLLSGIYGVGADAPSDAEWLGVIDNLCADSPRNRFQIGLRYIPDSRRFPRLEFLEQQLLEHYPGLPDLSLPAGSPDAKTDFHGARGIRLIGASGRSVLPIGALFARALGAAEAVHSRPRGGTTTALNTAVLDIWSAPDRPQRWPEAPQIILVSDESLLEAAVETRVAPEALVLVASRFEAEVVSAGISARVRDWARTNQLHLAAITTPSSRQDGDVAPWIDQQADWMLLGAATACQGGPNRAERCGDALRTLLEGYGLNRVAIDEVIELFDRGARAERVALKPAQGTTGTEPSPPWTISPADGPPLFDPARFWTGVAYLYDSRQLDHAVPDPVAATGWMPAGSSARRNLSQHRFRTPEWLPENCTGCGRCWALCPDSALPATARRTGQLISDAIELLKANGKAVTQLTRVAGHLATMADQLIAKSGPDFPRTAGGLLTLAFDRLADRMGLDGAAREAMQAEVDNLADLLADWPFAVTSRWYTEPERRSKGHGQLLTIPFNPSACKGCGVCVSACPDQAFDWRDYTPAEESRDRNVWRLRMAMADPAEAPETPDETVSPLADLLGKRSYHSLVGGDVAEPGSGAKTALHLVTAAIEAEMNRRDSRFREGLQELTERLRGAVQGILDQSVEINDFEALRRTFDQEAGREKGISGLLGAADPDADLAATRRVQKLLDALAEVEALERRVEQRSSGLFMAFAEGDHHLHNAIYPDNPHSHPWIAVGSDPLSLAEGLFDGIADQVGRENALLRRAEALVNGRDGEDGEGLTWAEFGPEERMRMPPVLVASDPADTDWSGISRILAGDRPIRIVLLDTTGPTPDGGTPTEALLSLARRHRHAMVSLETLAEPARVISSVRQSLEGVGASLVQVYAPEPGRCGIPSDRAFAICGLATASSVMTPLRSEPGLPEPALEMSGDPALTAADWALQQSQFRDHFTLLSRGHLSDEMKPLAEFIDLPSDDRGQLKPYIRIPAPDGSDSEGIALPSPAMVRFSERIRHQQRSAPVDVVSKPPGDSPPPPTPAETSATDIDQDLRQQLVDRLLELSGFGAKGTSLAEFLAQSGQEPRDPG